VSWHGVSCHLELRLAAINQISHILILQYYGTVHTPCIYDPNHKTEVPAMYVNYTIFEQYTVYLYSSQFRCPLKHFVHICRQWRLDLFHLWKPLSFTVNSRNKISRTENIKHSIRLFSVTALRFHSTQFRYTADKLTIIFTLNLPVYRNFLLWNLGSIVDMFYCTKTFNCCLLSGFNYFISRTYRYNSDVCSNL
jgi:hypothetical protein